MGGNPILFTDVFGDEPKFDENGKFIGYYTKEISITGEKWTPEDEVKFKEKWPNGFPPPPPPNPREEAERATARLLTHAKTCDVLEIVGIGAVIFPLAPIAITEEAVQQTTGLPITILDPRSLWKTALKEAGEEVIEQGVKAAGKQGINAFETALSGGKHAGWLKTMIGRSTPELQKSIESMKSNIIEHQNLIKNPEKYLRDYGKGNWNTLDPRRQEHLLQVKWPSDIQRAKEQINILEGIIKKR